MLTDFQLLCPADDIYPHFPNIYPIRGAPARSAIQWANTIKMLSEMDIDTMMGCHGPVVHGAKAVNDILNIYHDGIKYVHDQTIRGMEHLLSYDEIIEGAKLPKTLAEHPWLKERFFDLKHFYWKIIVYMHKNTTKLVYSHHAISKIFHIV